MVRDAAYGIASAVRYAVNALRMARTKLTAKKKEITEPIAITDPTELEIVTDEDEYDNMNTTELDKNEEACLIRTRLEEKLRETVTQYMEIMDGKI
ncbi:hypothetical protein NPIL_318771 [Nephila pilipes]|uniref:Uncharacterized protein n=1 Tax=Nephila pilipes TaxID=299642 RepID=A0A8X6QUV7_NEPPI|nr:hypothetical protein NPIL_318771 [Nephila pilipes]